MKELQICSIRCVEFEAGNWQKRFFFNLCHFSDTTDEAIDNEPESEDDEIDETPDSTPQPPATQPSQVSNLLKCLNIGCPRNDFRASEINPHIFYCEFPKP